MFGLTIDKFLVILVIALIIVGPEKLPLYAQKLGQFVKQVRRTMRSAKDRLRDEMGEDFTDVDWKQLDPRQYDPRRIILEAIEEDRAEERAQQQQRERQERMAETARNRYQPAGGSSSQPLSGEAIASQAFAHHRSNAAAAATIAAADATETSVGAGAEESGMRARVGFHYDTEAT